MTISNPNPNVVGYVCNYCQKLYLPEETICLECNEYDGMIPITKNILAMFEEPDLEDELGFCYTCGTGYDVGSRDGRCGDCGECRNPCDH